MVLMLSKFHCELNPTEMVLDHLKRNVQSRPGRNGKQTFNEMFMNSMQVLKDFTSLQMVKYANLSERFMSIYEHSMKHNIDVAAVDYIVKRFSNHRSITEDQIVKALKQYEEVMKKEMSKLEAKASKR